MIITPNQTQGTCPEDPRLANSSCSQDSDCKFMAAIPGGHGMFKVLKIAFRASVTPQELLELEIHFY